jgi:hypothetical protein
MNRKIPDWAVVPLIIGWSVFWCALIGLAVWA